MNTKQVLFRLDDSKLTAFDSKLSDKGMKRQTFFAKCVELFIEDKLSLDSNELLNDSSEVSNDNNEIMELKKQIAVILQRLDRIENDSKMITFDTTITVNESGNNDSIELSNDSLSIQSQELIGVEKTEDNLVTAILDNIKKEETTKESTPSESPNLPSSEELPQIVPIEENKPLNEDKPETAIKLSEKQKEILEKMKSIESGKTFESQSKLGDFLGLNKSEKPHLTKIKPLWENIIFSIESVNGSNQLVKL